MSSLQCQETERFLHTLNGQVGLSQILHRTSGSRDLQASPSSIIKDSISVSMDDESAMEKRYGRRSPLPLYQKKSSFSTPDTYRPRSRLVAYIAAVIFAFLIIIIIYGLPIKLSTFYPQVSPETIKTQSTLAESNQTGLVALEAHIMYVHFGAYSSYSRPLHLQDMF